MTGLYVRIYRDGRWQEVEIEYCTAEELLALAQQAPEEGWPWAIALARWIRRHVTAQAGTFRVDLQTQIPAELGRRYRFVSQRNWPVLHIGDVRYQTTLCGRAIERPWQQPPPEQARCCWTCWRTLRARVAERRERGEEP